MDHQFQFHFLLAVLLFTPSLSVLGAGERTQRTGICHGDRKHSVGTGLMKSLYLVTHKHWPLSVILYIKCHSIVIPILSMKCEEMKKVHEFTINMNPGVFSAINDKDCYQKSDLSCTGGIIHNNIHLINTVCPRPNVTLLQVRGLKHHSCHLYQTPYGGISVK